MSCTHDIDCEFMIKFGYSDNFLVIILTAMVDHDSKNYHGQGLCYLPKPKAEANNRHKPRPHNSRYLK